MTSDSNESRGWFAVPRRRRLNRETLPSEGLLVGGAAPPGTVAATGQSEPGYVSVQTYRDLLGKRFYVHGPIEETLRAPPACNGHSLTEYQGYQLRLTLDEPDRRDADRSWLFVNSCREVDTIADGNAVPYRFVQATPRSDEACHERSDVEGQDFPIKQVTFVPDPRNRDETASDT